MKSGKAKVFFFLAASITSGLLLGKSAAFQQRLANEQSCRLAVPKLTSSLPIQCRVCRNSGTRRCTIAQSRKKTVILPSTVVSGGDEVIATTRKDFGVSHHVKVGALFALWYVLNIGHNVYSKKALNSVPLPLMIGAIQMSIGLFLFIPAWLMKVIEMPQLGLQGIQMLIPMAAMHGLGHFFGVTSACAGAISFVHIVKASEPLFTALGSALFLNQFFPLPVYLTLLPVVIGVSVASVTELTFSWLSFNTAMACNLCCAARGIFAKSTMQSQEYKNLDALNLYNVLTAMAALVMVPLAWFLEGGQASAVWDQSMLAGVDPETFALHVVLSGLFHYLYNAVAFLALDNVHPVTHAVGNTLKRVVIIGVSMVVFNTRMTLPGTVGSAMAVGGTLLYSLASKKSLASSPSAATTTGITK